MMHQFILSLVFVLMATSGTTKAELTDSCLACMCYAESAGCQMPDPPCKNDGWSDVCGPWSITYAYWMDGGYQGGDFYSCTSDWQCSESTVRAYMGRYVTDPTAHCEAYARTHVGGPWGAHQDWTLTFWHKVEYCLEENLITPPNLDTTLPK
ncbi:unnamed protein product [Meganyctiphanes norvegica]|uniref:lysozyme n=1 Tax=Meganyctiphanes norvegica TaxID=48144 RepID=A0AAV2QBI0_MEGNR